MRPPGLGPDASGLPLHAPHLPVLSCLSICPPSRGLEGSLSSPSQAEASVDRSVRVWGAWGQLDGVGGQAGMGESGVP